MNFGVFRKLGTTFFTFAAFTLAVCSCSLSSSEADVVTETAEKFGNHLFNYELKEAATMTTTESRKWIELLASNVDSSTVELIRSQDEAATVNVDNMTITTDSTATVELTASNFVWAKDIDRSPEVVNEMRFEFSMVKRSKKWFVRMDSLLQSGK